MILEKHTATLHGLLPVCPFTFLYLSSEDSNRDDTWDSLSVPPSSSDDLQKQGVSHVPVTAEQVLDSDGQTRLKWMEAGRKELDNLTNTGTIEQIKVEARKKSLMYVELPAKGVFTIRPDKFKARIVACGNKTAETYGKVSTTDLDTSMMRYLPCSSITGRHFCILECHLPPGRVVVMRPPTILYKLQLLPPGHV